MEEEVEIEARLTISFLMFDVSFFVVFLVFDSFSIQLDEKDQANKGQS